MKHLIQDELTHLPVSRQRKYQLRMQREGRCATCGEPVAPGSRSLCLEHLIRARERQRQKQRPRRRYLQALSYHLEPGTGNPHLPTVSGSMSAPLRFTFDTDGLEVAVSSLSGGEVTRLGLTISLQTFLSALTWICSSNKAPLAGWLTVALGDRSILCRVEEDSSDSSSPKIIPASKKMPSVLRAAIRALCKGNTLNGN